MWLTRLNLIFSTFIFPIITFSPSINFHVKRRNKNPRKFYIWTHTPRHQASHSRVIWDCVNNKSSFWSAFRGFPLRMTWTCKSSISAYMKLIATKYDPVHEEGTTETNASGLWKLQNDKSQSHISSWQTIWSSIMFCPQGNHHYHHSPYVISCRTNNQMTCKFVEFRKLTTPNLLWIPRESWLEPLHCGEGKLWYGHVEFSLRSPSSHTLESPKTNKICDQWLEARFHNYFHLHHSQRSTIASAIVPKLDTILYDVNMEHMLLQLYCCHK